MKMNRRAVLGATGALALSPLAACGGVDKAATDGVPSSAFDDDSTAEEVTEGIDLTGKIAVVTGCNSGIGYETMRVLAMRGAYVVGTARTLEKAKAATKSVAGVTTPLQLELSDFDSIVACADILRSLNSPIDILVCNAGMRGGDHKAINGVEEHFLVNHIGHFLLVNRIIDRMFFSWQGRVVVVGSRAGYGSAPDVGIEFDNIEGSRDYSVSKAYAHSKLANALFSLELSRQLKGTRITSNALHPGVINTEIDRELSGFVQALFGVYTKVNGKSIEEGAATSCYVATSPLLGSVSGQFFEDCNAVTIDGGNHPMHNSEMASRLWTLSEEIVGDYLVKHERPDRSDFENGPRLPERKRTGNES